MRIWIAISAVAAGLILFAIALAVGNIGILLVKTDVQVYVNDAAVDAGYIYGNPEAFIYNGTPYVAADVVSNALGQKVSWDEDERRVYIGNREPDDKAEQARSIELIFGAGSITEQLAAEAYRLKSDLGGTHTFVIFENNSDINLRLHAVIKFYNKHGTLVGTEEWEVPAVEKKTKRIINIYRSTTENYESMSCELTAKEDIFHECLTTKLSYETVWAKNKEIVSVTNNSNVTAKVEGYALYFKKEELVDFASAYFWDDNYELKPGQTVTEEMERHHKDYDSVEFYFSGYGDAVKEEGNG